mgnify:CR=1 FL=1
MLHILVWCKLSLHGCEIGGRCTVLLWLWVISYTVWLILYYIAVIVVILVVDGSFVVGAFAVFVLCVLAMSRAITNSAELA